MSRSLLSGNHGYIRNLRRFTEYVALTTMVSYVSVVSVKQNALISVSKLNGGLTSNR